MCTLFAGQTGKEGVFLEMLDKNLSNALFLDREWQKFELELHAQSGCKFFHHC